MPVNSLDVFFAILDELDRADRDEALGWAYEAVISPRYRPPRHRDETLAEMRQDPADYAAFKRKCYELKTGRFFLVHAIVSFVLSFLARQADDTYHARTRENKESALRAFRAELREGKKNEKDLQSVIRRCEEMLEKSEQDLRNSKARYRRFCETVLPPLILEPVNTEALTKELEKIDRRLTEADG
jgi:hypothetical protein